MLNYGGHFEVHLTVRAAGPALAAFRTWSEGAGCKCVHIVLDRGTQVEQPMATWRRSATILPVVLAEATQRARDLDRAGFTVTRVKIEVDPSNEDVPATDAAALQYPAENYFEQHVKLHRSTTAAREPLLQLCVAHGAHLSHNAWRQPIAGFEERFVTLRAHRLGRTAAEQRLERLVNALVAAGEQVLEVDSEYTVYDSNLALDAGWLPTGESGF